MEKVKSIGKFSYKMFEVSLPLLMFGAAFHSYYCGEPWTDTVRWIWTGVIILILYWFSRTSAKIRDQFAKDMGAIVDRNWELVRRQDAVILKQEEHIMIQKQMIAKLEGKDGDNITDAEFVNN
jgi:hypothetical protein